MQNMENPCLFAIALNVELRKLDSEAGKLNTPPQVGGEISLSDLGGYAKKAGKKAAEMGRFFASEWLREPGTQQMLVNKANPWEKVLLVRWKESFPVEENKNSCGQTKENNSGILK